MTEEDIIKDARFIFESVQIDKPSDLVAFIERYRKLDEKYNPFWLEPQVYFHDGNLRYICKGDFEMLIDDNTDNPFAEVGLSEMESIVLRSFVMRTSPLYRLDLYENPVPPIVITLCNILDSALNKLPRYMGESLTRACAEDDKSDFQIGEMFIPNYALTTTADMTWVCEEGAQYIITPLKENTRARAIYKVNDTTEKQVTFLRDTPFVVKDIKHPRPNKTEIYFEEVKL